MWTNIRRKCGYKISNSRISILVKALRTPYTGPGFMLLAEEYNFEPIKIRIVYNKSNIDMYI